jgi:hypothetical protein
MRRSGKQSSFHTLSVSYYVKVLGDISGFAGLRCLTPRLGSPVVWQPSCQVSAQKPFYLIFSSLPSSFEREILVRTNTFFIFFGTEALKAKNLVHERWHLPRNLVS